MIIALCASATLAAHAASSPNAPTDTCALDYQIEGKWNDTPRRFDVRMNFDVDAKGEATLLGPKSWGGVEDFDKTIIAVRVLGDGVSLQFVESNQWQINQSASVGKRVTVRYRIVNGVATIDEDTPIYQPNFHRNALGKSHFQLIGHGALVGPRHLANSCNRVTCITFSGLPDG